MAKVRLMRSQAGGGTAGSDDQGKSGAPETGDRVNKLRKHRPRLLMGIILVGALALAACGSSADLKSAPDFQIDLHQGDEVLGSSRLMLSDLQGKPLVLNFWAGLCPPCIAEMPDLQEFYEEYNDRVSLVGVDLGVFVDLGSKQDGIDLLRELQVTYPAGFTSDPAVARDYKVLGMPSTVFITADGKIFRSWTGLLNKAKLAEITENMLR